MSTGCKKSSQQLSQIENTKVPSVSQGSSVKKVIGYGQDDQGSISEQKQRDFPLGNHVQKGPRFPHSAYYPMGTGGFSSDAKARSYHRRMLNLRIRGNLPQLPPYAHEPIRGSLPPLPLYANELG
jgi:hypothetical protein